MADVEGSSRSDDQRSEGSGSGSGSAEPLCDRARALTAGRIDPDRTDDADETVDADQDRGPAPDTVAADRRNAEVVAVLRRAMAAGEWSAPGLLAQAYLERGARLEAAELLAPAVMVDGHADLAGLLGTTLAQIGDHDRAEQAFLVGLDIDDADAMNDYGVFLRSRGRAQEATYVFDRAARGGADLAPLNLVALHLEVLDDLPSAEAVAEEFQDEKRPSTLVALAEARLAGGRIDDAETLYRRATELGGACAHLYYGWFLVERRGDPGAAEEHLRRAHEVGDTAAAFHLGRFLHEAERFDEAEQWLEYAAARGDQDALELLEIEYRGLFDQGDD